MTHDIAEALKLGTKVLVMDRGIIQQYDTPEHIRQQPATEFVRRLVGEHPDIRMLPILSFKPVECFHGDTSSAYDLNPV